MTQHTIRIAFLKPVEHAESCNRAANALGRSGLNFAVRLSPTGQEPATHLGGSAAETALFLAAVAAAPDLPEGVSWPEELAAEDWQAAADHLVIASGPAATTSAVEQFAAVIEGRGLQRIEAKADT